MAATSPCLPPTGPILQDDGTWPQESATGQPLALDLLPCPAGASDQDERQRPQPASSSPGHNMTDQDQGESTAQASGDSCTNYRSVLWPARASEFQGPGSPARSPDLEVNVFMSFHVGKTWEFFFFCFFSDFLTNTVLKTKLWQFSSVTAKQ